MSIAGDLFKLENQLEIPKKNLLLKRKKSKERTTIYIIVLKDQGPISNFFRD